MLVVAHRSSLAYIAQKQVGKMDKLALQVDFRFRRLNKMQALTLSRELEDVVYTEHLENDSTRSPYRFDALVRLCASKLDAISMFYVRQGLNVDQCDILIRANPTVTPCFTLPTVVNQMLKHIDCALSFSLEC